MRNNKLETVGKLTQRNIMERVISSPDRASENDAVLADLRAKAKRIGYRNFEDIICRSLGHMALELISAANKPVKRCSNLN